jgi:cobalt-zinc-cadmium efflux system outer membrane protein
VLVFSLMAALVVPAAAQNQAPPMTFADAVQVAIARNLELAAVRRGRAIRQAELQAAGQRPNPELAAEVTRDTPHGDISLAYPLDITGTRARRVALAREGLALADLDERLAVNAVRREVRLAFYGSLGAERQAEIAEGVLELADKVHDAAQARFEAGAAPRLEVIQAELGVVRARSELELARASRRAAEADLNALLNRPAGTALVLAGEVADSPPLPPFERATVQALGANLDLLAADREVSIEQRRLDLLRAERVPAPLFSAGTVLDAPGEFDVGAHAGVSMSLPLFSRNQGQIAGTLATIEQIQARRDAVRRQVEARVVAVLERATSRRAQVDAYRVSVVPMATTLQELANESYRLGRTSILAALDAQRSLRDVSNEYVEASLALQAAIADLEDVLGGPVQ